MPTPNSNERHRKSGTRLIFQRTDIANQPAWDLGVLDSPPTFNRSINRLDSKDERTGASVLDESVVTEITDGMTFNVRNQEAINLAIHMGGTVTSYTQSATAVTNQVYASVKGKIIQRVAPSGHPNAGSRMQNVTSVTVRGPGGSPASYPQQGGSGANWILDADAGTLFIPTNSGILDGNIEVSYTPTAIAAGVQINPLALAQGFTGFLERYEIADSGATKLVERRFGRLSADSGRQLGATQDNWIAINFTALIDASNPQQPSGYVRGLTGSPL